MATTGDPESTRLPYPHARNDCEMCRERDADVLLVDEPQHPGKRLPVVCQGCLGPYLLQRVIHQSGPELDQPTTVRLALAPARRSA